MEKGLKREPPRRVSPWDGAPVPVVRGEPVLALEPAVALVEGGLLGAEAPAALLPACGEPAAACVWWCSGPGVAVAVPVWAVSFISAVSVGMILPSRKAAGGEANGGGAAAGACSQKVGDGDLSGPDAVPAGSLPSTYTPKHVG
jgi:hypothetical protein